MLSIPILNYRYPSCYSANSFIPKSQVKGRDIKHLIDKMAEDDKRPSKLMKIASIALIAAVIINRSGLIENGKVSITDPALTVINPPMVAVPTPGPATIIITTPVVNPIPDSTIILPEPEVATPCTANITAYRVILKGRCSDEEIDAAYFEKAKLFEQREKDLEAEGRRMADESNKKWDERIEKAEKVLEETIRRNAQTEDSPEAIAESLKTEREVACQMHQNMGHLPGFSHLYTPVCVKNEIELLGADMSDNCDKIKKIYREQSLLYHPDKNSSPDANAKFNSIADAYKKICP